METALPDAATEDDVAEELSEAAVLRHAEALTRLLDADDEVRRLEAKLKTAKEVLEAAKADALAVWPQGFKSVRTDRATVTLKRSVFPRYLAGEHGEGKHGFIAAIKGDPRFEAYREVFIREDVAGATLNAFVRECDATGEWPEGLGEILGASEKFEVTVTARR